MAWMDWIGFLDPVIKQWYMRWLAIKVFIVEDNDATEQWEQIQISPEGHALLIN